MNAERLHAIVRAVRVDLETTEEVSLLEQLATSLRNMVNDPATPDYGTQTAELRARLNERLATAPSNSFSAAWHEALEELGIDHLLGERLRQHIDETFRQNEITVAAVADEVGRIHEEVTALGANVDQLVNGLLAFSIGADELAPGEFEIGFLIPRGAVDDELGELGRELVAVKNEILGPIQEMATGGRGDLKISVISSSDFEVFLETVPQVALVFSQVLVDLLAAYERIKQIREKISEMLDAGVPEEAVASLREYANTAMDLDVTALADRLIAEHAERLATAGRTPDETRMIVERSLRETAKRIDERYTFEVRSYPEPPEPAEGEEPRQISPEAESARQVIEGRQQQMRRLELSGEPILELNVGDDG